MSERRPNTIEVDLRRFCPALKKIHHQPHALSEKAYTVTLIPCRENEVSKVCPSGGGEVIVELDDLGADRMVQTNGLINLSCTGCELSERFKTQLIDNIS